VVNGILTIPLTGKISPSFSQPNAAAHPLAEFVAGPENILAVTALRPYLNRTDIHYSPLVLYGPHGSGKSHLAHGLAAWWRQHFPTACVSCSDASEFADAYAAAIQDQRLDAFRRQTRDAALFVLEDLGQLSGKRGAQQELLHALDALAEREALVVVTARSLPMHWPILLPSLRSRLSAGLAVPLALPGPATRRALLERLSAARGIALPKRVVQSLADGLNVSVPVLIAAVLDLELAARAGGPEADSDHIRRFMAEQDNAKVPSLREIAGLTAKYFGLRLAELKSPRRRQPLVAGRGVAMYLARQLTDKSLQQIGEFFGGRDHTTVLHGYRRTEKLLGRDRATRQAIADLKKLLLAP
jgi:chromosomal replication initiator protein